MTDKMTVKPGSAFYCYSDEEVVWLHDPDHTPHNKRYADSDLKVQVRAPLFQGAVPHISFEVIESTTTKGSGKPVTRNREVWFTMKPEHFDAIAAHVNRAKTDPMKEAIDAALVQIAAAKKLGATGPGFYEDLEDTLRAAIGGAK